MSTDLVETPNPKVDSAANPAPSEPAPTPGTSQPSSDATGQGASAEETFTQVNPNTLPPQLRESYNNMLRDYKAKTTGIADRVKTETEKATQEYRDKADWYDKILGQEEFVKQWNTYVDRINQETAARENDPQAVMQKELAQLKAQVQESTTLEAINTFANAKNEKGELAHPDFDKLNSISVGEFDTGNGKRAQMSMLNVAIRMAEGDTPQERIANGYKSANAVYNAIYEEGKKAGLGRMQTKALSSSEPPTISQPGSLAPHRAKNALEALEFARQGLAVPKD